VPHATLRPEIIIIDHNAWQAAAPRNRTATLFAAASRGKPVDLEILRGAGWQGADVLGVRNDAGESILDVALQAPDTCVAAEVALQMVCEGDLHGLQHAFQGPRFSRVLSTHSMLTTWLFRAVLNDHSALATWLMGLALPVGPTRTMRQLSLDDACDALGKTSCISYAARDGLVDMVRSLCNEPRLGQGLAFRKRSADKWTCLHVACKEGHHAVVRALLENVGERSQLIESKGSRKETALHVAAQHGHAQCVQELIGHENAAASSLWCDAKGRSCLMLAAVHGHADVVRVLCSPDPWFGAGKATRHLHDAPHVRLMTEIVDSYKRPALWHAIDSAKLDVVRALCESARSAQVLKQVLHSLVQTRGGLAYSCLTHAVEVGQPEIVQYMVAELPGGSEIWALGDDAARVGGQHGQNPFHKAQRAIDLGGADDLHRLASVGTVLIEAAIPVAMEKHVHITSKKMEMLCLGTLEGPGVNSPLRKWWMVSGADDCLQLIQKYVRAAQESEFRAWQLGQEWVDWYQSFG
jgi:hypothetical protein